LRSGSKVGLLESDGGYQIIFNDGKPATVRLGENKTVEVKAEYVVNDLGADFIAVREIAGDRRNELRLPLSVIKAVRFYPGGKAKE
jgi:hypothetical protein